MKVRFTPGRVRVRLDDLELAALVRSEALSVAVAWPGGGWTLTLNPQAEGLQGEGGGLVVGLRSRLPTLLDPVEEGVTLPGPPRVVIEKDFGPQHL
ncbi:hypothetical protein K7W42_20610 [Deinococcus sp. HMF7604]|uniref:hypothetical protein n=1 Tax=Deinococcus betulae TaxID=2873312 RepID=UPI001CCB0D60|nr:hypothetical protein [Deinococcus betulae]MBZ9753243.1 hypothetical protein [Deinococcus betulae]